MEQKYEWVIVLERDKDGVVMAVVPPLLGRHTMGDSEEEALALIQDTIALHIEALGEPVASRSAPEVPAGPCYDPSYSRSQKGREPAPVLPGLDAHVQSDTWLSGKTG
jgi:predicted RNase H-like HicB family nuclease